MSNDDHPAYQLTIRPAGSTPKRYEYVIARHGHEAVRSTSSYPTADAAEDAGHRHGRELSSRAPSTPIDERPRSRAIP